jgi:predicted phosphate transport protein (TIGR00153 family)
MKSWIDNYFTHESRFRNLFKSSGDNITVMAGLLVRILNECPDNECQQLFNNMNTCEKQGDDITHAVYLALEKTYFPPLKRKDIHVLASVLDDVADHIQETTSRIDLYKLTLITPSMTEMALLIAKAIEQINLLIDALYNKPDLEHMYTCCKQVKYYEHQTDLIYYRALADLFANEKDAITLLKYRDIFYSLETAANKCKNTADAVETMLINSI